MFYTVLVFPEPEATWLLHVAFATSINDIRAKMLSYVLITAARNEEKYIEQTILSVLAQTIKPLRWVIVSDGSLDGTDDIVRDYCEKFDWISLLRAPEHVGRDFAAKSNCVRAAWATIQEVDFDVFASCDADISFEPDYMEFLLSKFRMDPKLGVAGTPFIEAGGQFYDYRFTNIEHVSGGCQLFRRECFEEIGGFTPIKIGGEDWIAVTSARMKGWKTRTFSGKSYNHLKRMGTGESLLLLARFKSGYEDYLKGGHPVWEFFRAIYQLRTSPILIGSLFMFSGYLAGGIRRPKRPISKELIRFHRKEQLERLKNFLINRLPQEQR